MSGVFACSSDPNQQGGMCGGQPQQTAGTGCKKGFYSDDGGKTCKPQSQNTTGQ